jgi:hypothetical protein
VFAAEGADAEAVSQEGAEQGLAEFVLAAGGDREAAEAVGVGFAGRDGLERVVDGGEGGGQAGEVAGDFDLVGGVAEDFAAQVGGGALGDDAALVDDEHAVAGDLDFGQDVGGDDDRHAAAQAGDEVAHDEDLMRVEADGGLVHDDHGRFGEDGLGDADALAVAFGELADDFVADALQVADFEDLVDARAEFAAGTSLRRPRK